MPVPNNGGGGEGSLSEFSVQKYRMDNSMCAQKKNKPTDSDSSREKREDSREQKLSSIHQRHCLPMPPPTKLSGSELAKETALDAGVISHHSSSCLFRYLFPLSRPRCPEKERGCCQHGLQRCSNELF